MSERYFEHQRQDTLSELTRKKRRWLLGMALLGFAVAEGLLIPSKIPSLGIEFQFKDLKTLMTTASLVVGYFLFAFTCYATSDFMNWYREVLRQKSKAKVNRVADEVTGEDRYTPDMYDGIELAEMQEDVTFYNFFEKVKVAWFFRAVIVDLVIPVGFGLYIIICLLFKTKGGI